MTQQSPKGFNPLKAFNSSLFLKKGVSLISGIGILTTGLVWSQLQAIANSEVTGIPEMNTTVESNPAPVRTEKAPPLNPVTPIAPSQNQKTSVTPPKVQLSAPKIVVPTSPTGQTPARIIPPISQLQPPQVQFIPNQPQAGKNNLIDTTNYSAENPNPQPPSAVAVTERRSGAIAQKRPALSLEKPLRVVKNPQPPAHWVAATSPNSYRGIQPVRVLQPGRILQAPTVPQSVRNASGEPVQSWKPVLTQAGGATVSLALEPIPQYNRATTMTVRTQTPVYGRTSLIFPLPLPAQITSSFGWRLNPISGSGQIHAGTDIGAPIGTPVLAAYPGQVAVADWVGGYGLMVILRHENGAQESRYAHLSEIFVKPGEEVQQGAVIGRVGSTGYSTGPHLHFEWRHLTTEGWIPVDAGQHLEYALDNLLRSIGTAQANPQPEASNPQG